MVNDILQQLATWVDGMETWQQVLALIPIGAIPFIESFFAALLGTAAGIHPAIAIPAAVVGNMISTFAVIALSGRARDAVSGRRERPEKKTSKIRQKVAAALDRYGVPGVALLGPFVIASQITAPTMIALGATRSRVYLWMGVSITAWGLLFGLFGNLLSTAL
ncbi:hypothetical protein ACFQRD_12555 [Brachybacterium sp. GCM10030268]|uniref:hypothetical protein n=1 Tax=Brachybacterium sp. GCM10030268 TaxID=3273382 RepID=UPI00361A336C